MIKRWIIRFRRMAQIGGFHAGYAEGFEDGIKHARGDTP